LILGVCGDIILKRRRLVCFGVHLTGRTEKSAVASALKMLTTFRNAPRKTKRFYVLAVTLLAFGLFSQAVHAKNSDYFPTAPHSTRYSTTIKIADLAHHIIVADPATVSATYEIVSLTQPKSTRISYVQEIPPQELSAQISFRPLRSPPVTL
jgi:hypothetical protein